MVKPATIGLVPSLALSKAWSIHQFDVENAFFHGNLNEIVYMHHFIGFHDPIHPSLCLQSQQIIVWSQTSFPRLV